MGTLAQVQVGPGLEEVEPKVFSALATEVDSGPKPIARREG